MIERQKLISYLDDLLACSMFKDYSPNGLQVEGAAGISSICTAVTASAEIIDQAISCGAQALIVHHGYFWRGEKEPIIGNKYFRIAKLIRHEMNLFAYHLPLDCHRQLGNNYCFGELLGVNDVMTHQAGGVADLLWTGKYKKPCLPQQLEQLLTKKLNRKPLHVAPNDKPIAKIAWCTGAAQDFIEEAAALGAQAYISGEVSERTYYQALELGLHYFAAGHHATERYGIQALGDHLAEQFSLHHQFIDSLNPI